MFYETQLTMYRAPVAVSDGYRRYQRVEWKPLREWYRSFDEIRSLLGNEALLGALETAASDGHSAAHDSEFSYVFFEGKHPATTMTVDDIRSADLRLRDPNPDDLDAELGSRRIAWSPVAFHGSFVSGDSNVEVPDHELDLPWRATTRQAVVALKGFDFEDCEAFLGERIITLAKAAAEQDKETA